MEKLLILGTDLTTETVVNYCRSMNVHTIITDSKTIEENPLKEIADEFWSIDYSHLDELEARCRAEGVTGVFAGSSEPALDNVKELTKRLELPFYASDEGWASSRDKIRFKQHCINAGLDVPKQYLVSLPFIRDMLDQIRYPVIVKPIDGTAGRGITICRSEEKLIDSVHKAMRFSLAKRIIVEEYIEGTEVIAYFFIEDGKAHLLHLNADVFDKNSLTGVIVKKHTWAKQLNDHLGKNLQCLFDNMECKNGIAFIQMIRKNDRYYPFEMGYRLDGIGDWTLTSQIYGFDYLKAMVNLALGRKTNYNGESVLSNSNNNKKQAVKYLILGRPGKVVSIEKKILTDTEGVEVTMDRLSVGSEIRAEGNMLQMPYYLSIVADNSEDLIWKIKQINSQLVVTDENGNNLLLLFESYDRLSDMLD